VPSAPLCAQPAAERRRHTECACYVDALFEIHRSPQFSVGIRATLCGMLLADDSARGT
jgi:hypothetical protein